MELDCSEAINKPQICLACHTRIHGVYLTQYICSTKLINKRKIATATTVSGENRLAALMYNCLCMCACVEVLMAVVAFAFLFRLFVCVEWIAFANLITKCFLLCTPLVGIRLIKNLKNF